MPLSHFPSLFLPQDSLVQHDFILTSDGSEARLRRRGQDGDFAYTLTFRVPANGRSCSSAFLQSQFA